MARNPCGLFAAPGVNDRHIYLYGFADRHPYIVARQRFVAGEITREQAAAMCATDREWIAECDLEGHDPYTTALQLTRGPWAIDAVRCIQDNKWIEGVAKPLAAHMVNA